MYENDEFEKRLQSIAIPEVTMEQHKSITGKKLTTLQNSSFIGVLILTVIAIGVNRIRYFIDLPSLQFTILIPLLLIFYSYRWQGVKMIFTGPFHLNAVGETKELYVAVYRDLRTYFVISGWLGTILALILMANTGKVFELSTAELVKQFGVAGMTLLYGYFFGYFFAYPVQKGIENNHY